MNHTPRKTASRPAPATGKTKKTERASPPRPAAAAKGQRILRLPAVVDKTGLSRATVYRRFGHMRIALGANSAGWLESDIDAWIAERVAASRGAAAAVERAHVGVNFRRSRRDPRPI